MIQVKAPDGSIVQFPDGMPEAEMLAAMQREFGGPAQTPAAAAPEPPADMGLAVSREGLTGIPILGAYVPQAEAALKSISGQGTYAENLAKVQQEQKQFQEQSPFVSTAAQIIGGAAATAPLAATSLGATALGLTGKTTAGMVGKGALSGATIGGADALVRGADPITGAALGGTLGAAGGLISGKMAQRAVSKAVPTTSELKTAAESAYDIADKANVVISPQSWGKTVEDIKLTAAKEGFHPNLDGHRDINVAIRSMEEIAAQPITFRSLEQQRRILTSITNGTEPDAGRIAGRMIDKLDNFAENITAQDIRMGTAAEAEKASSALRDARDFWRTFRKGEAIENLIERAKLSAGQYSQSGMENALRKEFRAFAKNQDKMRGFSPAEKTAIVKVANGGPVENITRLIGKMAPRGVVSGGFALGAGALGGAGVGGGVMLAGEIGKRAASAMTMKNAQRAAELVRSGGVRPEQQRLTPEQRAKLAALLGGSMEQVQRLPFGLGFQE